MRNLRCARFALCTLFSFLFFAASLSVAQEPDEKSGRKDDPAAREQWFRRGRQSRKGQPAAKLLHQAYLAKMKMRSARESKFRALAASHSTVPRELAASVGVWDNLGPRPIVDSPTTPNGYGPLAGRVTAIAVDQSDATGNTVLAAGAYGGVWRSTNAAASDPTTVQWSPLIDDQATLSVGAVSLQPGNSNVVLVGTGEPNYAGDSYFGVGILRSTDGGATWNTISGSTDGWSFYGSGVAQFAWSTKKTNMVMAATSLADNYPVASLGSTAGGTFLSTDAGASWTSIPFTNDNLNFYVSSASSVIYNPTEDKFYAVLPFLGFYVTNGTSTAGFSAFVRLPHQPGTSGLLSLTNCGLTSSNCQLERGALTVRPVLTTGDPNQMYTWFVGSCGGSGSCTDEGIWRSTTDNTGTVTWTQVTDSGITTCGDSYGCGTQQTFYNLYVSAVPNGSSTDLYAGAINIFKTNITCSGTTCSSSGFKNLTHVYGCNTISMVHPDQHAIDFLDSNTNIIYFGDDGGVNRALTSKSNLNTGTCPSSGTQANVFDNLNSHIGPLTQFVWGTNHPTDPNTLMGGSQDNGTMAVSPACGDAGWWEVNSSDGGYNWIDPVTPTNWYSAYTGVSIQKCTSTINCNYNSFLSIVQEDLSQGSTHQVDGDNSNFYTPYILDPAKSTQIIVGTCRVWRGGNTASAWPNSNTQNALSHQLGTTSSSACGSAADPIQALAAGGPANSSGSSVIYAGTSGGHIYSTTNATTGVATWTESPTDSAINPNGYPVSAVAVDPHDATGMTVYAGIQGFTGGSFGHLYGSTNGGATWTDQTDGMPDVPVNDIVVDPDSATTVFVATDAGVFQVNLASGTSTEIGPTSGSGYLPNVAVLHIAIYENGSDKRLRAFTHGRGVFETGLTAAQFTVSGDALSFTSAINVTSATQTITLTNNSSSAITVGTPAITGPGAAEFSVAPIANACSTSLAANSSCQIGVEFSASSGGNYSATLTVTDGSSNMPTVKIALTGDATAVAADFSFDFGGNPASATVSAGQKGTYTFNLDGSPNNSTSFSPALTLTCSVPAAATKTTCSLTSSSLSAPGSVTMYVQTTATTTASARPLSRRPGAMLAALSVPVLGLLMVPMISTRSRRKRVLMYSALLLTLICLMGATACGGGGGGGGGGTTTIPGTPAGTYTVTITGAYGITTHTQNVTLIVQ